MALSYGGIELIVPTREISDRIADSLDPWELHEFCIRSWPGKNLTGITFAGHVPLRPVRVGSLYWPTGASRWAVGHFLASDNQLAAIRQQAYPSQPLVPVPLPLTISSNQSLQTITASMYMLPPRPIYQIEGANGLSLLTLVDQRYFWWLKTGGNLIVGAESWDSLWAALGAQLGTPILADTVSASYFSPSSNLSSAFEVLPTLLDAVAYNVGQRLVVSLSGGVSADELATCIHSRDANITALAGEISATAKKGGQFVANPDMTAILPSSVQVVYPQGASFYPFVVNLLGLTDVNNLFDFSPYAGSPGQKTFHETAIATTGTPPGNNADLSTLSNKIACDYYGYQLAANLDKTLNGIIPWDPDGLHDITWTYLLDRVTTRVNRPTFNSDYEELLHNDGAAGGGGSSGSGWQDIHYYRQAPSYPATPYFGNGVFPQKVWYTAGSPIGVGSIGQVVNLQAACLMLVPFLSVKSHTLDKIRTLWGDAGATPITGRIVVYSQSLTQPDYPGALLYDSGDLSLPVPNSLGPPPWKQEVSPLLVLNPNQKYYVGIITDHAPLYTCLFPGLCLLNWEDDQNVPYCSFSWFFPSYPAAMPDPFPAYGAAGNPAGTGPYWGIPGSRDASVPQILLHYSS